MIYLGSGQGPVLLNNVECNQSHTNLSQCVHELSIGLLDCRSENIAGVTCQESTTSLDTTTATKGTTGSSSTTHVAILSTTTPGTTVSSSALETTESSIFK